MDIPLIKKYVDKDGHDISSKEGDRFFEFHGGKVTPTILPTDPYLSNFVVSSSYTLLNFLPLNLFEQFHNMSNIYFAIIGALQLIPETSTTGGDPSMWYTLTFILFVSAVRAATEDIAKHKADSQRNNFKYLVLNENGKFVDKSSGDIQVGNICKILKDQMIPCDMLFLDSALDKHHCFIDKANLNGETTLEVMNSIICTRKFCEKGEDSLSKFEAELVYEPPNKRFDSFRGILTINGEKQSDSLDGKALLMRETNLRNCDYIYGLVVYTGNNTKIQVSNMSGEKPKIKQSHIMRMVDKLLGAMFLCQFLLCLFGGIYCGIFTENNLDAFYLAYSNNHSVSDDAFFVIFTWLINLSQMVPISLVVSAELVKFIQSKFIQSDINLYYNVIDKPAKCNRSTIHEDLGLVDYVFSDKTGTLTQNKMQYRYCLISDGNEFGSKDTEIAKSVRERKEEVKRRQELGDNYVAPVPKAWTALVAPLNSAPTERTPSACESSSCCKAIWYDPGEDHGDETKDNGSFKGTEFNDEERHSMNVALWGPPRDNESKNECEERQARLRRYIIHMALSNTVKPYEHEDEVTKKKELRFQAESAEELAMVLWARTMGFTKLKVNPTVLEVQERDQDLKETTKTIYRYNHICTCGFSSARARVSVVYQDIDSKAIHVMTKGQDTTVLPLLEENYDRESLELELNNMCSNGLRTLVGAYAELPADFWTADRQNDWMKVIGAQQTSHSEGHKTGKCARLPKCEKCFEEDFMERLEVDAKLQYMGVIGMEDQLQLLVPETIKDCLRAGIKVWMITGDKLETAKNIGLACNLIEADMQPQIKAGGDVNDYVTSFENARLLEITGQWASLATDNAEMGRLFDLFDFNKDGEMDLHEFEICMSTLRFSGVHGDSLKKLFAEFDKDDSKSIDKNEFMELMQQAKPTPYEAVLYDVMEGINNYKRIADPVSNPVSVLVNRTAFQVMFPGPAGKKKKEATAKSPAEEEIEEAKLEKLREMFFLLASLAKSVVFARAEPAMKKRMVTEIMARNPKAITLAIGDGANDTDMIMAAHVGVGIAGVEGTAAVNSADYAIGTFRMLHDLLFVHGFWNYHRVASLVNFIFYKAVLLATSAYWFGFFSGFAGQQFYVDSPLQLYNVVYTALPVMAVAVWDQVLSQMVLSNNPVAYREAKGKAFDAVIFGGWVARSIVHGVFIYFIVMGGLEHGVTDSSGHTNGLWYFSTTIFFIIVMLPSCFIILQMNTISLLSVLALCSSYSSVFLFTFVMSEFDSIDFDFYKVVATLYSQAIFWFLLIFVVMVPILFEIAYRGLRQHLRPSFSQIVREKQLCLPIMDRKYIQLDPSDEQTWLKRKPTNKREMMTKVASKKLHVLSDSETKTSSRMEDVDQNLKAALIRSMLRFRNLTGANFDSATEAAYQTHDNVGDMSVAPEEKKVSVEDVALEV